MSTAQILGIVRHIITFGAGIAVSTGHFDPQQVQTIAGGLAALLGGIWSVLSPEKSP